MKRFSDIWCVAIVCSQDHGERPVPLCIIAKEINSGRFLQPKLKSSDKVFFGNNENSLVVSFKAAELINCFKSLGWPVPVNLVDLYAEYRCLQNGKPLANVHNLNGVMDVLLAAGGGYSNRNALCQQDHDDLNLDSHKLLNLCNHDLDAIVRLLSNMAGQIDWARALYRGNYMKSVAAIEWYGCPIDMDLWRDLQSSWHTIKNKIIAAVDKGYGVYDGLRFNTKQFEKWLVLKNIPWPRLKSGSLALDKEIFKMMASLYPEVALLKELRSALSLMRSNKLAIGKDGRNRCDIMPFKSKTSRNQPSTSRFIFGPSVWVRGLIKPKKCMGLAYIDFSQQEFGIAAALSGDENMKTAYRSGDPYLAFAKQAGVIPQDATKQSHPNERDLFKQCVMGIQYGMGKKSLSVHINRLPAEADIMLKYHRQTYKTFWSWSDAVVNSALLNGYLKTELGWRYITQYHDANERSIRNFPMQANAAEILRVACILAIDAGVTICCPVHDAILIESHLETLDEDIKKAQDCMVEAGRIVLDGFELLTDTVIVRWPHRYMDKRGQEMWNIVIEHLNK